MDIKQLEELIKKHFIVTDKGIVKLVCAVCIAHKLQNANPVWLFLIAPPSGLKSELIRGLKDVKDVYPLSSLTAQTFISGQKNPAKSSSLLHRISRGILTFKDFTTVLQLYEAARQEILSQLREIYDGQYSKAFGNGEEVNWEGKITFIAGVTEAVDLYSGMYSILGERFLQYRMVQPDRILATTRALKNSMLSDTIRQEVSQAFSEFINNFEIPAEIPEIDASWQEEIIALADFATRGRTGVKRDPKDREISNVFESEMPMRFSQQLILLAKTFALIGNDDYDREILRKIALDSLPKNRIKVFSTLLAYHEEPASTTESLGQFEVTIDAEKPPMSSADVATRLGLPTGTTRRILQDMNALGFLEREKASEASNSEDLWKLKPEWLKLLQTSLRSHL